MRAISCLLAALIGVAALTSCAKKDAAGGQTAATTRTAGASPQPSGAAIQPAAEKPKIPLTMRLMAAVSSVGKIFPRKQRPPQALPARPIGEVRQVNMDNRFVLIDGGSVGAIEAGAVLVTVSDQRETADLKLTALRSASFLIADITGGTPSVGDKVFAR